MRGGRPGREGEEGVSGARGAWWQVRWLYLQLVVGAVDLLVVINLERLQELEVKGEAALHPDAVVAAQVRGVGLGVLQARDVARRLCVQLTAALGLAGMPVLLQLVAQMAGTEVAANIVMTQMLAQGLQVLLS